MPVEIDAVEVIWFPDFEKKLPDLTGKRIVITGTTSGTGFIAAQSCLQKGAEVILLNRGSERATKSLEELKKTGGERVSQIDCDLQSFASVRKAVKELEERCAQDGVDVLSCNAGIMCFDNTSTVDGYDVQMQTNQLSHFLLVKEALPWLKVAAEKRGEARIVTHSSLYRHGSLLSAKYLGKSGPQLGGNGEADKLERYHQSKLANVLFVKALQSKLERAGHDKIKAIACAPGIAATSIHGGMHVPCFIPTCLMKKAMKKAMQSQEDGTMPLLTSMVMPEALSGDLWTPSKDDLCTPEVRGPPRVLRDPMPKAENPCVHIASQDLLWAECEKAIGEPFAI